MAGSYYDQEEHSSGPYRPAAAQFDTMNMGPGPQRVAQFDTVNLGTGPHRVPQFDTMNVGEPMRVQEPPNSKGPKPPAGRERQNAAYYTDPSPPSGGYTGGSGGQTPMNPALETQSTVGGGRMNTGLVIADLSLHAATVVSLIIGVAVLASNSQVLNGVTISFSSLSATKYALAAAIVGFVYSIYETVSAAVRLAMGHSFLPGNLSLYISYIGDQVVIVLLLTGASAAAATFKDLHDFPDQDGTPYCDSLGDFCKKGAGAIVIIFVGFCFLAASLVISSYCFYKRKS